MKKIIVLFALLLGSIISIAQPVTQRGTSAVTVQDSRLFAELNFRPPAFPDTVRANQQIGLDSCGALIFSRDINAYYYRACSPKRWVRVASGGSTSDSAYLSYRPLTDSTFLLCRVGGTRCDTIKVNGKGVTQAWLLGGNLNPVSNNLGTISTTDVVIITNDVARMKIAGNGINRSSAARNRYLMIDTLTRYLFYGDESDTTAWKLLGNSNAIAGTSFLGTTNNVPLEFRVNNKKSGYLDSTYKTTSLGYGSLRDITPSGTTTGTSNVSIGYKSMNKDTTGYQNTSLGTQSLLSSSGSIGNVSAGYGAMGLSRQVYYNVGIGWGTLSKNYYGYYNTAVGQNSAGNLVSLVGDTLINNTFLGAFSAYNQRSGRNNLILGDSAGRNNISGSRNVFIGSRSGANELGSDKLYIANSSTSNPLIKGNFADSTLNVNGKMSISLTSQTPDSSLDVTGGVKLRTIYRSSALTDSMLLVGADGGVVKREVIVPSNTNVTRIISGSAVWDSLLVYSVTKCFYYINGILYNSPATNVTLAAADSSNPRIDVIYCDTLGNVGVITGIPSPNPVKPTVNPLSQIELTHININAQATTPAGVNGRIIYNENVGIPNEWNTSTDVPASGIDFAYTVNPYVGTKSAFAPAYFNSNYSLIFTNNAFVNADTLSELSMYLRQNSAPPARTGTTMFSIILFKSGVQITKPILVTDGLYGYSLLTLNSYQHLAIPFSDFLFRNALDKTFDQIQIVLEYLVIPKAGYQFDYITIVSGGNTPPVTGDFWSLSGNDNTSFPNAKLGTTSSDQLSIVTDDIERINIANTGVISLPQLQTTTDTLLYKPLVINPTNGQVAGITNWGNNTVYTETPIMSRTSGDSNIIYFNADTANAWRGGGGVTPGLQEVLIANNNASSINNYNLTLAEFQDGGDALKVFNAYNIDKPYVKSELYFGQAGEPYFNFGTQDYTDPGSEWYVDLKPSGLAFKNIGASYKNTLASPVNYSGSDVTNTLPLISGTLALSVNGTSADANGNITISAGGTGTVTDISQGYGITASPTNPITTSGTITVDTTTSGLSGKYLRINDTTAMLSPYAKTSALNLKLNISDTTAMLSPYAKTSALNLKLNISDTSSMLLPYLRKVDTTNRFVNNVTKKNDSTITVFKGSASTDIVLPRGSAGSSGTVTNVSALTLGTSGTDLNSTVSNSTTTPVITLNVPNASTIARGVVDTTSQTFAGNKTFVKDIYVNTDNGALRIGKGNYTTLSGNANLVFGYNNLNNNTTGSDNIAIGGGSLNKNTNGNNNIAIGANAGSNNTTGRENTFIGAAAGSTIDTGYRNIAIGYSALTSQVFGDLKYGIDNIAIGHSANNRGGTSNNIIIGNKSLTDSAKIGSYNTIIGTNVPYSFSISKNVIIADGLGRIRFKDDSTNTILPRLAGTGTRMVTAGTDGELSTQAIPSGGGGVTSISQGYGITNSPNPIVATGTVTVDTSVSGLSGKYLRIVDTTDKWVNNISRTIGKDSIIFFIGSTRYAIKDSVGTNPPASGYYGAWQDNVTQTAAVSNTGYAMIFRTIDLSNGVSVVTNGTNLTRITFANTGVYNLQFSSQFQNTDNAQHDVTIWLRLNGSDVAGSSGLISVPARKSAGAGNEGHLITGWNYVLNVVAGQYYELMWSTSNAANVTMQYYAAGSPPPSAASVIMTVTQQAGILAGTGITAINSLTGSAQTMVTGTDSTDFKIVSTGTSHTFNLPTASATNRGALSSANWTTFNNKIGASDTSVFQRKSISSYTMLANNTNATGNATAQTFRDTAGTYAGTITWNGTAPTTQTINAYQWQQTGKMVHLQLFGYYTNTGTACSSVTFTLPSDCPAPDISMFTSGALATLYQGIGALGTSNVVNTFTTTAYMRRNAANTGNELYLASASANYRRYQFDITYRAQ